MLSKLYASHVTLRTPQSTLYTHTVCTLGTPHSTFTQRTDTLICTLSHFTLDFRPPQLCPFHTWHCMEPWPNSIVMLRAHIYLSSWTFATRCITSSHASKGPLLCRRWTFEFSRLSCHDLVFAECLHWFRATVDNNHMFSKFVFTLALPSVFHAHHPAKLAFDPYPLPSNRVFHQQAVRPVVSCAVYPFWLVLGPPSNSSKR